MSGKFWVFLPLYILLESSMGTIGILFSNFILVTIVSMISMVTIVNMVTVTTMVDMVTTVSIVILHVFMIYNVWSKHHHTVLSHQAVFCSH